MPSMKRSLGGHMSHKKNQGSQARRSNRRTPQIFVFCLWLLSLPTWSPWKALATCLLLAHAIELMPHYCVDLTHFPSTAPGCFCWRGLFTKCPLLLSIHLWLSVVALQCRSLHMVWQGPTSFSQLCCSGVWAKRCCSLWVEGSTAERESVLHLASQGGLIKVIPFLHNLSRHFGRHTIITRIFLFGEVSSPKSNECHAQSTPALHTHILGRFVSCSYCGVQKWLRIRFYYLRDIYHGNFAGLGQLGNICRNSGVSTESERWQPALRGTPSITGLAPVRIIYVKNCRKGPFSPIIR